MCCKFRRFFFGGVGVEIKSFQSTGFLGSVTKQSCHVGFLLAHLESFEPFTEFVGLFVSI